MEYTATSIYRQLIPFPLNIESRILAALEVRNPELEAYPGIFADAIQFTSGGGK